MADPKMFSQEEVDALITEKLAAAKAEGDKAFQSLWDEAKKAKERAKAFEGIDPEEAKALRQKVQEMEQAAKATQRGITSEQLDKMRGEIRADLEKDYSPWKSKAEEYARENRTLKLDNVVKGVMSKNGVRAERIDALYRLAAEHFDLTEDGKPMVKDRMGITVDKFVADDLMKQFPEFFNGSGSSGGGATKPTGGASGAAGPIKSIASPNSRDLYAPGFLEDLATGKATIGQG